MNKKPPVISVVTGCFNGAQFIERAFNSILNQTYAPIELIFVNDGSTDTSLSIAQSFQTVFEQKNIAFIIIDQENKGYYPTSGIKQATGKYITTLDIDDYLMPESLEKRVSFLEKNKEYGGVRTNGFEVNEDNLEDQSRLFVIEKKEKNNEFIFEDLLFGRTNNWAGSYTVRTSILFEYYKDKVVPGTRYGQNLQILMPIAYKHKIGFIDEPLMKYIRHSQSFTISNNTYENRINQLNEFKNIRISILDFLNCKTDKLISKLNQSYLPIFLNVAYTFDEVTEFNAFYKELQVKTISEKITFHTINKNKILHYFYRILNKINRIKQIK